MSMANLEKKLRADGYALVRLDAPPEYGRLDDLKRCFGIKRSTACERALPDQAESQFLLIASQSERI